MQHFVARRIFASNMLSYKCYRNHDGICEGGTGDFGIGAVDDIYSFLRNQYDSRRCETSLYRKQFFGYRGGRCVRYSAGRAPLDYVLSCRVAKAQKLIAEGNYGKTDIANICGFYDVSHMNKYI